LSGKTTLQELAELIRGAEILISNETSAVHIAAAVGTNSVCILGGGHFGRFLPYPKHVKGARPIVADKYMPCFNCNWKCEWPHEPSGAVPCVTGVSIEQVLRLIPKVTNAPYLNYDADDKTTLITSISCHEETYHRQL
jgi:ADP-heptose:LPS heptosyltransferase